MAKVPETKSIKKVREADVELFTGYLRVYGETPRSLVAASFDMDDGGRCAFVLVIHKVSKSRVLNPFVHGNFAPVHERVTSVWDLVRA